MDGQVRTGRSTGTGRERWEVPVAARVVVVGGGYGGCAVARQLDDVADVVLVEPRDGFLHTVGALRAAVDPAWESRVFRPYDRLLDRGRVVRDWVRSVGAGVVLLSTTRSPTAASSSSRVRRSSRRRRTRSAGTGRSWRRRRRVCTSAPRCGSGATGPGR